MRVSINNVTAIVAVLLIALLGSCNSKKDSHHTHDQEEYTCPMHPQVIQDRPGSCPVCGMDLVKKSNKGGGVAITEDLKKLIKPTNSSVIATIKSVHPERRTRDANSIASGVINYDTRKTYTVPIRFSGRIEKLYVKYNYQAVMRGQVIMEVYSPEMVTAQRELLYVASEQKDDKQLLESSKQKLRLLGLTEQQIEKIIADDKESFALPVLSPYTGYIVESTLSGNAIQTSPGNSSMSAGGMNSKNESLSQATQAQGANSSSQQILIREGMYVTAGQSLFKIVDCTRLWAELYFPATEASMIRKGSAIELHVKGSDVKISSKVDFIQPFFSDGSQFLKVRSYLNSNEYKIRVGQLITGEIAHPHSESLWIPREAILDLGVQQIVFLKNSGTFAPSKVKTGVQSGNWIEVKEGLNDSSEIASNAQYLVDSESFIKVDNQ